MWRVLSSGELDDIDADEKRPIDKASPFRFKSEGRIWELTRPQFDGAMVDVLESGRDTGGGVLDMFETLQRRDNERSGSTSPATL